MTSGKRHQDQFSPAHQNSNHCTLLSKISYWLILGSLERHGSASPPHLLAGQYVQPRGESVPLCANTYASVLPPGHMSRISDDQSTYSHSRHLHKSTFTFDFMILNSVSSRFSKNLQLLEYRVATAERLSFPLILMQTLF